MRDYLRVLRQSPPNAKIYLVFTLLLALYAGINNVIFNLYVIKLGYNEQFLGLIISASTISTGVFAFPAAQCCDRLGSKACLILSGLLTAGTLYLLYTVTSAEMILAMSVLGGVFGAIPVVIAAPFLARNSSPDGRLHLFSLNFGLFVAGSVLGSALGGYLPQLYRALVGLPAISLEAYRYALLVSLVIATLSVVPLIFIRDEKTPCPTKNNLKEFLGRLAGSPTVRQLVLISCLIGTGAGMFVPFFNVYFNKLLAATPGEIGLIFSAAQASMVVGAAIVPYVARRFGKVKTVSLTYLISLPFLVLLALTTNLYVAGAAYVLRMLFMNMSSPVSNSFSMEIVKPEDMASVSSLTSMGDGIAIATGSLVGGVLMTRGIYTLPFFCACALYTAASILYYKFFRRHEERKEELPQPVEVSL